MLRVLLIGVVAMLLAGIACVSCFVWDATTHRVTIRNDNEHELIDVELAIDGFGGDRVLHRRVAVLPPGDSVSYFFAHNDPEASLGFTLGDRRRVESVWIDLWTGEDWIVAVNEQGEVTSSYDY